MGDQILAKINDLLKEAGYQGDGRILSGVKSFLNDSRNKKLAVYDQVAELYDMLIVGQGMW